MKNNKFELTEETIQCNGHTLHRIKALKDFGSVHKGDIGGFVEKKTNLSQKGNCWIFNDAKVFDNAIVYDDAKVSDDAEVYGNAKVYDKANVYNDAWAFGNAEVCGHAKIYGNAEVCGNTQVSDDAYVFDSAKVGGDAHIGGNAWIYGNADIIGDAQIKSIDDYAVFKNFWSSGRYFTWTKSNNMWKVGCFYGTGEELIKKAYKDSDESGKKYEATVNYIKSIFN